MTLPPVDPALNISGPAYAAAVKASDQQIYAHMGVVRADIPSATFLTDSITLSGHTTVGDLGAGAVYVRGTSSGPMAIQDAAGTWWNLALPGYAERGWFGASGSTNTSASIAAMEAAGGGTLHFAYGSGSAPSDALTGTWPQYPNVLLELQGPADIYPFWDTPYGDPHQAKRIYRAQDAGSHADVQHAVTYTELRAKGAGKNGPGSADIGHYISVMKHDWGNTSVNGEIDGMYIVHRTGGPDVAANGDGASDGSAILADLANIGDVGYLSFFEATIGNIARTTYAQRKQINIQAGAINSLTGGQTSYGYIANSRYATNDVGYIAQEDGGLWTSFYKAKNSGGGTFFDIRKDDFVFGPTGWIVNAANSQIAKVSNGFFQPFKGVRGVNASFSPDLPLDLGRTLVAYGASPITMTIGGGTPLNWWCDVILQDATSPVTFAVTGGASLLVKSGHTKLTAQGGKVRVQVIANTGGSAAVVSVTGDTSA